MLSLTENTHRDKSLTGFSIYACGVRYVLTHSICLLRERGIYLISNWRGATIYRQKKKQEQEYKDFLLVLLLSFCLFRGSPKRSMSFGGSRIWVWAYPIWYLYRCATGSRNYLSLNSIQRRVVFSLVTVRIPSEATAITSSPSG